MKSILLYARLSNEWYARDISRKVTKALRTRHENGAHYGAYAPLGYRKDPEQVGHLLVDDETKWIIEKIFALAVQGNGPSKIANLLIAEQISTPSWFQFQRYGTFAHIYEGQPEAKRYAWSITQVKSILQDENSIGNSVHNRQANVSYKSKKRIHKPKDEWWKVENTHEAIISREDFDRVQEHIASRRRRQKDGTTQIFAGLVKCADCG
ncbi:MAG: recombinase family protein, partial [Oscillospiraceae bacterium]